MLALGLSLDFGNVGENFTDSIVGSVIKLVISSIIILVLLILLNMHGMVFNITILEAGMSPAGNTLVLAIRYNLDNDLMGSLIFTNVVLSIVTLMAIISFLTGAI